MAWLSQHDVELFFKALAMDNGRANFWLQYVHAMQFTRLVVGQRAHNEIDSEFREEFRQGQRSGRHATLLRSNDNSAIIIQFGSITVVEFTKTGNAAYCYGNPAPFSPQKPDYIISELKLKGDLLGRILHHPGWEHGAKDFLRKHTLLPQSNATRRQATSGKTEDALNKAGPTASQHASVPAHTPAGAPQTRPEPRPQAEVPVAEHSAKKGPKLSTDEAIRWATGMGVPLWDRRAQGKGIWVLPSTMTQNVVQTLEHFGYRWRYHKDGHAETQFQPFYVVEARDD